MQVSACGRCSAGVLYKHAPPDILKDDRRKVKNLHANFTQRVASSRRHLSPYTVGLG